MYILQKKTICPNCNGCDNCVKGFVYEEVDLLEVLRMITVPGLPGSWDKHVIPSDAVIKEEERAMRKSA
jgi:hypothetical protein